MLLILNRLEHSVNNLYMHGGRKFHLTCFIAIFALLQWPATELIMSLKHVCKGYSAAIDLTNESIIYHDLAAQRTILPPAEFVHSGQI